MLDDQNPSHAEVLNDIKRRFREETFTRESIMEAIAAYPELVSLDNPQRVELYRLRASCCLDPSALRELCDGSLPEHLKPDTRVSRVVSWVLAYMLIDHLDTSFVSLQHHCERHLHYMHTSHYSYFRAPAHV